MTIPLYPDTNAHGLCLIPVYASTLPDGRQTIRSSADDNAPSDLKWRIISKATGSSPGWAGIYDSPRDACSDYERTLADHSGCMDAKPEIDRMLTLSTAHISPETVKKLRNNPETDELCMTVYPKAGFGWYVYFSGLPQSTIARLPEDLKVCITAAQNMDCAVLCFDCDASPLAYLPVYED